MLNNLTMLPDSARINSDGCLEIADINIPNLIKEWGSPLYILDYLTLKNKANAFVDVLSEFYPNFEVLYAAKANLNIGLLNVLSDFGLGVDVVSEGELFSALKSKMDTNKMVLHGNNKSIEFIQMAINAGARIIIDNLSELKTTEKLAAAANKKAIILLRLKPNIDADTHRYIKTGHDASKFGIDDEDLEQALTFVSQSTHFEFRGIHAHIGSQILNLDPYFLLIKKIFDYVELILDKFSLSVKEIDFGGGFGIPYTHNDTEIDLKTFLCEFVTLVKESCQTRNLSLPKIMFEPGRYIVAQAGMTFYSVGALKVNRGGNSFVFVDGGMADNIRPMLYNSKYCYCVPNKMNETSLMTYELAGKYCESSDVLDDAVSLPKVEVGDLIGVCCTGAYNYSMASNYNRTRRPAMLLLKEGEVVSLVKRETFEDIIQYDVF